MASAIDFPAVGSYGRLCRTEPAGCSPVLVGVAQTECSRSVRRIVRSWHLPRPTERRAGQLLREMEKAKRGPDLNGQGSQRATSAARPRLRDRAGGVVWVRTVEPS